MIEGSKRLGLGGGTTLWKRRAVLACTEVLISIVVPPGGSIFFSGDSLFPAWPFFAPYYIFPFILAILSSIGTKRSVEQDEAVPRAMKLAAQFGIVVSILFNSFLTVEIFRYPPHSQLNIPLVPLIELAILIYHGYITFQLPHCKAEDFRRKSLPKFSDAVPW